MAFLGGWVSACRKQRTSPVAMTAPACIWVPRPREAFMNRTPHRRKISGVPSLLPPSTTSTSTRPRSLATAPSVASMMAASLRVGIMMDSIAMSLVSAVVVFPLALIKLDKVHCPLLFCAHRNLGRPLSLENLISFVQDSRFYYKPTWPSRATIEGGISHGYDQACSAGGDCIGRGCFQWVLRQRTELGRWRKAKFT